MDSKWIQKVVALLLATSGLIDIPYGWYYVAGYASYVWYGMGAFYLVLAVLLATKARPHFSQPLALAYTLFLLAAWATGGNRDIVAIADKIVEAVLAVGLVQLIRITWPPTPAQVSASKKT